jgi:hypothetical protein
VVGLGGRWGVVSWGGQLSGHLGVFDYFCE